VEGNQNNPVNLGKTCARGQISLHGLYNPDRVQNPGKHVRGENVFSSDKGAGFQELTWLDVTNIVADALTKNQPDEVAFLVGMAPDHLFDLVTDLTQTIGAPAPVRFGALGMFEARTTLMKAAQELFGQSGLPFFDIGNADLVISFGANFLETWLSPVAQTRGYSQLRKGKNGRRGYFVQLEPRMSQTGAKADEWVPLAAGSEAPVALAIGRLLAEASGISLPPAFANADVNAALSAAGVNPESNQHLVDLITASERPVFIPRGAALAQNNGLQTAEAVLALNAFVGNLGQSGGVFLSAIAPLADEYHRPASAKEMADFVGKLKSGRVKTLFIHGVNPVFELPKSLGFADALANVPQVISFATFPDETA